MKKGNLLIFVFCAFATALSTVSAKPAYACLVEPCPSWPTPDNQPTQNRVGYFDNGGTVFYANGTSHCGFASPKHLEFFQRVNQAPSLGRQDPGSFGAYAGICTFPSGYFDNGGTVFFSSGNGTFCGFRNPQALESHQRSRPQQPSFGRLDRDPNRFMGYTGVCS